MPGSLGLAVVTGASRGLGRAIALALAREGYDLIVCARGAKELEALRAEVATMGRKCMVWKGDLTSRRSDHLAKVFQLHPVDVLINNAAYTPNLKQLVEYTADDFADTFTLNLAVPVILIQAVVPTMKVRGSGTVVNICSLAGRRAIRKASLYCASKFALRALTESLGQELEGTNVRCFSVSPGGMNTEMRQAVFADAAQQQDPTLVAKIIVDAIAGRVQVPQGGDLVVRGSEYTTVSRELWTGIKMEHQQGVPV